MLFVMTRFPLLADVRLLSFAVALAIAVLTFVTSGDPAAAGAQILAREGRR